MSRKMQSSQRKYAGSRALTHSTPVIRQRRDCSLLTIDQLRHLAAVPGNADVAEELERRQAR